MSTTLALPRRPIERGLPIPGFRSLYIAMAFAFICGAFTIAFVGLAPGAGGYDDRQSGTPILQAIELALYAPTLLLMLSEIDTVLRTLVRAWPLTLLVVLSLVSAAWSVEPGVTVRRAAALALTMAFALYAATTMPLRRFHTVVSWVFVGIILASALAVLVPGFGIDRGSTYHNTVRGIFPEKNLAGRVFGLALIALFGRYLAEQPGARLRLPLGAVMALGFVLLVFSNARTPLLSFLVAAFAMWAAGFLFDPRGRQQRVAPSVRAAAIALVVLLAAVVVPAAVTVILMALGRNLTLTGRLNLWTYAIGIGWHRPMLGAGFGAFWTDALTFNLRELHAHWEAADEANKRLTGNAHNGYLDVWLELGFAGLGLLLATMAGLGRRAVAAVRRREDRLYLWPIGVLTFMAVYYLTNSGVMDHSEIGWFSIAYAYLALAADRRETLLLADQRHRPLSSLPFEPRRQPSPA